MIQSLKGFLISIFLVAGLSAEAQDIFLCDTTGIVKQGDSIIRLSCNYFFNFTKLTKDSVLQGNQSPCEPLTIEAVIKNNTLNGPIKVLRKDSNIILQGFMKNGLADSIFTSYHISMENYKTEAMKSFFRNGLKEGEETEYNSKGVIIYIRNYKEGLLDGEYKHFDDYGNLLTGGFYEKGKREDVWTENFPEEHYSVYTNYKDDELVDYEWKSFFKDGKTFYEGTYDRSNLKQGTFKVYSTDGMLLSTETYKDGKRHGYFTEYDKGKIVRKTKYKNDKIVGK